MAASSTIRDHNAAEAILQNLARRPNVQSTLILARKDGSIIKASGAILQEQDRVSQAKNEEQLRVAAQNGSTGVNKGELPADQQYSSQIEALARGVYDFVVAAESLGSTVQAIKQQQQSTYSTGTYKERGSDNPEEVESLGREDVQLLRLRLVRQEVIIFPDPKYLCCVVQGLESKK